MSPSRHNHDRRRRAGRRRDFRAAIRTLKNKLALVYVRQSHVGRARPAASARARIDELVGFLLRWGWPASGIKIVQDRGRSGSTSRGNALGKLLELMAMGTVGIVLVEDLPRLARDPLDTVRFVAMASWAGVLIGVDGHLYDPTDHTIGEHSGIDLRWRQAGRENRHRARLKDGGAGR